MMILSTPSGNDYTETRKIVILKSERWRTYESYQLWPKAKQKVEDKRNLNQQTGLRWRKSRPAKSDRKLISRGEIRSLVLALDTDVTMRNAMRWRASAHAVTASTTVRCGRDFLWQERVTTLKFDRLRSMLSTRF